MELKDFATYLVEQDKEPTAGAELAVLAIEFKTEDPKRIESKVAKASPGLKSMRKVTGPNPQKFMRDLIAAVDEAGYTLDYADATRFREVLSAKMKKWAPQKGVEIRPQQFDAAMVLKGDPKNPKFIDIVPLSASQVGKQIAQKHNEPLKTVAAIINKGEKE